MAIKDALKVTRKTFFNPSEWLGYSAMKANNRTLWEVLKDLFTMPKKEMVKEETFEQAMQRLNMTEDDVESAVKNFRSYAIMFVIIGMTVFFYAFYLLFSVKGPYISAWLLGVATSALFLSQAFKYDFWSFQMKRRQLGATFEEWKRSLLGD